LYEKVLKTPLKRIFCCLHFFLFEKRFRLALVKTINLNLQRVIKMEKFNQVKELIASLEADADKFYAKGNSAAGTRIRKGMQDLKNLAQAIRLEVQESKNKA
jgi:hypothetical protein